MTWEPTIGKAFQNSDDMDPPSTLEACFQSKTGLVINIVPNLSTDPELCPTTGIPLDLRLASTAEPKNIDFVSVTMPQL